MILSDKERKLILLAFDPAAQPGESVGAIRALAKQWIPKYEDGHALIKELEGSQSQSRPNNGKTRTATNPYAEFRLGFGKHAGEPLKNIPADYLVWTLHNFKQLWPETRNAIERYLDWK
jgi:hypothetical protein